MTTLPTADEIRGNHRDSGACLEYLHNAHEARRIEMLGMLDKAGGENRSLLASESREYNSHETELRKLALAIDEVEAEARALTQARSRFTAIGGGVESSRKNRDDEERARAFLRGEERSLEIDLSAVEVRENPETGRREVRDLSVGTSTAGGATVGASFAARLFEHMIENSGVRRTNVTVFRTSDGEDLTIPKTTAHSSAAIVAEGAAISESDPAFSSVTLDAFKYGLLIQTTRELIEDSRIDLVGYLARQAGRAIGNAQGAHFVTGDGTAKPNGIVTAATVGVTGATGTSGVPTADELIDLYFSVIEQYRARGFWLMADSTWQKVRKLKDANNNYLVGPLSDTGRQVLLGRPVVVDPNVATTATSAKSVVFGDFSEGYAIRDVNTVRFERSDDYAFANDLVTWRALHRSDGDAVDASAVKVYQGGAS